MASHSHALTASHSHALTASHSHALTASHLAPWSLYRWQPRLRLAEKYAGQPQPSNTRSAHTHQPRSVAESAWAGGLMEATDKSWLMVPFHSSEQFNAQACYACVAFTCTGQVHKFSCLVFFFARHQLRFGQTGCGLLLVGSLMLQLCGM